MRRPSFGQIMAALFVIGKIHSTLSEMIPIYSEWTDNFARKTRKKLGLAKSFYDKIVGFLGTEEIMEGYLMSDHSIQDIPLWHFLYEKITPHQVFDIVGGEENIQLYRLTELDMISSANVREMETDVVVIKPFPRKPNCLKTTDHAPGLCPFSTVFGYYKERPFVFQLRCDDEDEDNNNRTIVDFLFDVEDKDLFNELSRDLKESISGNSPLKNWIVSCEGDDFDGVTFHFDEELCNKIRYEKYDFDINLYNDDVKNLLHRDISNFIKKQEKFCKDGFDGRRAYLLEGPPGTGKSDIIKTIASIVPQDYTTIILNEKNIHQLRLLKRLKFLFPALVIIEDIDLLVTSKSKWQELLNFLDGLNAPDRIITIMTSNNKNSLISAITNRPGRIDRTIYVGPGNKEQRIAQLKSLTKNAPLPDDVSIEALANITEGYSVAELRELVRRSIIYTTEDDDKISYEALTIVLAEFARQKEKSKVEMDPLPLLPETDECPDK